MTLATPDESVRRVRSLCGSLECILICAETVEQNASHIGSALFLLTELKDAIEKFENAAQALESEQAASHIGIASEALGFYADADNYKPRHGQPSAVAKDTGHLAREALQAIDGEEGQGEESESLETSWLALIVPLPASDTHEENHKGEKS